MQLVQPQLLNMFINILARSCVWSLLLFAKGVALMPVIQTHRPKQGVINFLLTDAPIDEVVFWFIHKSGFHNRQRLQYRIGLQRISLSI